MSWRGSNSRVTPTLVACCVDGCFWHQCPEHGSVPVTNRKDWAPKLARNEARDREVDSALAEAGWLVVRVWEHQRPEEAARTIRDVVREGRDRQL